jgi:hypothetical protein
VVVAAPQSVASGSPVRFAEQLSVVYALFAELLTVGPS